MAAFRLVAALLLLVLSVESKKVARVKAGKTYKDHAPVHIVVNKVGYVTRLLQYSFYAILRAPFLSSSLFMLDVLLAVSVLFLSLTRHTHAHLIILSSRIVRSTIPQRRIVTTRFRFAVLMRRKRKKCSKQKRKMSTCLD